MYYFYKNKLKLCHYKIMINDLILNKGETMKNWAISQGIEKRIKNKLES